MSEEKTTGVEGEDDWCRRGRMSKKKMTNVDGEDDWCQRRLILWVVDDKVKANAYDHLF
jgi:hypothetical protein